MGKSPSARDVLEALWARHSHLRAGGALGMGGLGVVFWCQGCRAQWPCPDAKILMRWGQIDPADDWEYPSLVEKPRNPEAGA